MSTGCAYNPRGRVALCVFTVGVIESGKTATCTHLFTVHVSQARHQRTNKTNLLLIGKAAKILTIWFPRNEVSKPRTQFWIFAVVRDLPSLESKAGVDAKCLVVEVSRINKISENENLYSTFTYSESFLTDCQLGGKLTEGMGHAGQRTASSPGEVPSIPPSS